LPNSLNQDQSDFYVRKTTPDSFLKTDLLQILKNRAVTELIVCGYATEFCVDTTIRSAAAKGFQITLVSDTHTTHDKPHAPAVFIIQHHNATLPNIKSFGVTIRTEQSELVEFSS
jgi:nicotinamidase-related amidase